VVEDILEDGLAEIVALEQVPEPANRGLVRRRALAEVDPAKRRIATES